MRLPLLAPVLMFCTLCMACLTSPARAGVEQFIDDQTILAGEIDLSRVDAAAMETFLFDAAKSLTKLEPGRADEKEKELRAALADFSRFLTEFKQHGGKTLYVVTTSRLLKDGGIAVVAPAPDDQAKSMAALLFSGSATGPTSAPEPRGHHPQRAEVVPGLGAVRGTGGAIEYIKTVRPQERPDLKAALTAAGEAPVKIAFAPDAGTRAELQKEVPPTVLEKSTALVWRDLKWASLAATLPPAPTARLVAQSADPSTAKQTAELVVAALALLRQHAPGVTPEQTALVTPTVQKDQLVLELKEKQLTALASALAVPLHQARLQAMQVQSMSNLRQLLLACHMYAADHQGQWPDELAAVTQKYLGGVEKARQIMTNPARPQADPGYTYLKPADPRGGDMATKAVMYETHTDFGRGVAVGFADGHVEFVNNRQRFDRLLAGANAPAAP